MKQYTADEIRSRFRKYSTILVVIMALGILIYIYFSGNPGMKELEREVHREGENLAILITGPIYLLGSLGNAIAGFFLGIFPAASSFISIVFAACARFFGIRKDGSVHLPAYRVFMGFSYAVIFLCGMIITFCIIGLFTS